jgi:hypothetical protein
VEWREIEFGRYKKAPNTGLKIEYIFGEQNPRDALVSILVRIAM